MRVTWPGRSAQIAKASMRSWVWAAAGLAAALSTTAHALELNVSVDCGKAFAPLPHFWRSCGYSPAQAALRLDGVENTLHISTLPRRGIAQVRIHFLLDILTVTGFWPNASSATGYSLMYDWSQMDFLVDTLVRSRLSPGFEIMGSPSGFPTLPNSFYTNWNNNFRVFPNQTFAMFRQLVADVAVHYGARYGTAEVGSWNFETWNEPETGWGWPSLEARYPGNLTGYQLYFDAAAAGIEDAEKVLGAPLRFGGPAASGDQVTKGLSAVLPWVLDHAANGTNVWTGAPGRLDFLSIHLKGSNTSYVIAQEELSVFTWMRAHTSSKVWSLPYFNTESDPLVGWLNPEPWRADARYAAILPKVFNQQLLQVNDNATGTLNNPVALMSPDNGFLTLDGYNGFEQRTLLARFADLATGRYALVRKTGLAAMALLTKLGTTRVAYTGAAGPDQVARSPTGVIASVSPPSPDQPYSEVSVLVYHSNDTAPAAGAGGGDAAVTVTLENVPFAPTDAVMLVHYRIDPNNSATAYAVWQAQGSPALPSSEQLRALWAADGLQALGLPAPVAIPAPGAPLVLDTFALPLPGVSLLHLAAKPAGGLVPGPPANLRALVKPPARSLLDAGTFSEVLVLWDCDAPRASSNSSNGSRSGGGAAPGAAAATETVPNSVVWGYEVQASQTGAAGPWTTVRPADAGDFTCGYTHAAPAGAWPGLQLWYRVAATDYWGQQGAFSAPAQVATLQAHYDGGAAAAWSTVTAAAAGLQQG